MTETITIDGKEYEVLTLDKISEITHAKLANMDVPLTASFSDKQPVGFVTWEYSDCRCGTAWVDYLDSLGIQPLKLVEREPAQHIWSLWLRLHSLVASGLA